MGLTFCPMIRSKTLNLSANDGADFERAIPTDASNSAYKKTVVTSFHTLESPGSI